MKYPHAFLTFFLPGMAALLSAPAHALPLWSPLLKPAPLRALLTLPQSALPASDSFLTPPSLFSVKSSLGSGPLWSRALDPTLQLTDWRHVFDIAALGTFDIPLRDDPAERANILLSAAAIDNAVVAPGAEFSFNDQVGERTVDRGYQDGLMFDNGQIVRGTGGGICLVATGLYNAALQAGLEITERHPHSGVVSYAPPGCDAGIYYGQEDFKFRNTTARPVVIRTEAAADHLTVQLFGQTPPPGAHVIVKPTWLELIPYTVITKTDPLLLPGQSVIDQKPRDGYNVVVERFWTQKQRIVRREVVAHETRAPRPKIVRVALPPAAPLLAAPAFTVPAPLPSLFPADAEPGD